MAALARRRHGRLVSIAAGSLLLAGLPLLTAGALVAISDPPFRSLLPAVPVPSENPITEEKRVLGKILFWDEQLSSDNTMACATCHLPARGGGDARRARHPGPDGVFNTADDVFGSPGVVRWDAEDQYEPDLIFGSAPQVTGRIAPTMIFAAYAPALFWDGRAGSTFIDPQTGQVSIAEGGALESQAVGPPLSSVEMAHADRDWNHITAKLAVSRPLGLATDLTEDMAEAIALRPTYPELFQHAFGDPAITAERIAFAIATYERTLIADDSPWDRYMRGDLEALTPRQLQGWRFFFRAGCVACHDPPLFTDNDFHNIGLRPPHEDIGRQAVTGDPLDRGKFKTPTLRNLATRDSFMHNGRFPRVVDTIHYYAQTPGAPPQFQDNISDLMVQMHIPPQGVQAIDEFIRSGLTDPRILAGKFPFDSPTLFSQRPADHPRRTAPGRAGAGNIVPVMVAPRPPAVGDADFKIGVDRALGGAVANLYISSQPPTGWRLAPEQIVGPITLGGSGAGAGYGTAAWPIPNNHALQDRVFYAQWVIADPAANGGEARSPVLRLQLFCGPTGCPPCPGDFDRNGLADSNDITDFLRTWFTELGRGGVGADFNGDGAINSADVVEFMRQWLLALQRGC